MDVMPGAWQVAIIARIVGTKPKGNFHIRCIRFYMDLPLYFFFALAGYFTVSV